MGIFGVCTLCRGFLYMESGSLRVRCCGLKIFYANECRLAVVVWKGSRVIGFKVLWLGKLSICLENLLGV